MTTILGVCLQVEQMDSYEYGPANKRHKLYYRNYDELQRKIQEAKRAEAYMEGLNMEPIETEGKTC